MKLLYLKSYDFPLGGAPQNRWLGICRGLIKQGNNIEVHVYAPSKRDLSVNHLKNHVYKDVHIYNHAWRWSPIRKKSDQYFGLIEGVAKTITAIFKSHQSEPIDYVFITVDNLYYVLPFFIISKLIGAKFGKEVSEYPQTVCNLKKRYFFQNLIERNISYRWYDIFIVISNNLYSYYKPLAKTSASFCHLPINVDIDRFPHPVSDLHQNYFITYCGDLSQIKDGVITLIRSFAMIKDEFKVLKLKLIGSTNNTSHLHLLNELIIDLQLQDRVIFTGYLKRPEDITEELYRARLLVLAKPNNIQNQGNFPTKLGEYLASGVPVVITRVGELQLYLKDEHNAFLADPDDIDSFADGMRRALRNDSLSVAVGLAGRETALKHFSHFSQGFILSEFLKKQL